MPYAFTLIFMLSIFITSGYLLQSVTEEKENRVVEILLSSIPALPLMAGKVLGLGAAGLTQVAIWVITALVALPLLNNQFSLSINISLVTLLLAVIFFGLGYLSYGAIFAAIGALAPGAREAQQYAQRSSASLPSSRSSSAGLPDRSERADRPAAVRSAADGAGRDARGPGAVTHVAVAAGRRCRSLLQVLFVVFATIGIGRIFRATLLLYGVRPSVRRDRGARCSPAARF